MTSKKNAGVQYIRAFACVVVFLSHLFGILKTPLHIGGTLLNNTPLHIFWGGNTAVIIFFLLSGFFQGKKEMHLNAKCIGGSILNRHLRIYPSFLLVYVLAVVARWTFVPFDAAGVSSWAAKFWMGNASAKQYLLSLVLIGPFDADMLNPLIWTLRIELRMCFVLPFFLWFSQKTKPILTYLISLVIGYFVPVFLYLPVFVLGMSIYKYLNNGIPCKKYQKLLLGVFGFLLMDTTYIFKWFGITVPDYLHINITAFGAVFFLAAMYQLTAESVFSKVLVKLGDLSYYIYLVHMVVMLWFRFLYVRCGFAVFAVVCVAVTYALAECIGCADRFFQKWLRKSVS